MFPLWVNGNIEVFFERGAMCKGYVARGRILLLTAATVFLMAGCPFPEQDFSDVWRENSSGQAVAGSGGGGGLGTGGTVQGSSGVSGGAAGDSNGSGGMGSGGGSVPIKCPDPIVSNGFDVNIQDGKYHKFNDKLDRCYTLFTDNVNWTTASLLCPARLPGSTLAIVSAIEEHGLLNSELVYVADMLKVSYRGPWIGGHRNRQDSTMNVPNDANSFRWMSGEMWTIFPCEGNCEGQAAFWGIKDDGGMLEPNGSGDCVRYGIIDWHASGLDDDNCDDEKGYICEQKLMSLD